MLCSAFAHIAVFSYDIRSFTHVVLILLVSFSILYMHVTRMIAILSSRRPECPFQFKQVRVSSSSLREERKS